MNVNKVNISGNLTRDSELRALPSGTPVLDFGIAVNDRRKNPQTGEWEDVPNFFNCTVFGSFGESMEPHLKKGRKVFVAGRLHYSSWTAKDGTKRSSVGIIVDTIDLAGGFGKAQEPYGVSRPAKVVDNDLADDDIPF